MYVYETKNSCLLSFDGAKVGLFPDCHKIIQRKRHFVQLILSRTDFFTYFCTQKQRNNENLHILFGQPAD